MNIFIHYNHLNAQYHIHITVQTLLRHVSAWTCHLQGVYAKSVLLYVHNILHLVVCNKCIYWSEMHRKKNLWNAKVNDIKTWNSMSESALQFRLHRGVMISQHYDTHCHCYLQCEWIWGLYGGFLTDLAVWRVCEATGPCVTTTFIHLKCRNCNACQKVRKHSFLYTA